MILWTTLSPPRRPIRPIGTTGGDHGAPTGVDAKNRRSGLGVLLFRTLAIQSLGHQTERVVGRAQARRRSAKDLKRLRSAVAISGNRQPVFQFKLAAVTLVTDDLVLGPQQISSRQPCPFEDPVVWSMDRVGSPTVRKLIKKAVVAAVCKTNSSELILGPIDQTTAP